MKRKIMLVSVGLAFFAGFLLLGPSVAPAGNAKVEVCHIPPGNPDNFHTITISENALPAHLAHGDLPGPCDANCEALCDDGDACTSHTCDSGGCDEPQPVDCDDSNLCTTDSCDSAEGCLYTPAVCCSPGTTCDPGTGECVPVGECGDQCTVLALVVFDQCVEDGDEREVCFGLAIKGFLECVRECPPL